MTELTLKEIQERELNLLKHFDNLCKANGFRYSLGGGSLLGAVRHKGFIPWDDDIDVMMPRPDYDAFLSLCASSDFPFELISYETRKGYRGLFVKLSDPKTYIVDSVIESDFEIGINIDIFPIDGLGGSREEALSLFNKTKFDRELLNASGWKKFSRSKTHGLIYEPIRLAFFLASRFANRESLIKKIEKRNKATLFETSSFAGCVCGAYREKEIMPQKTFTEYIELPFEDTTFMAISDYDSYLKAHYGDYMQLPPEKKRVTHHTYKAFLKE
ncbi:MAG: LicD family protein [Firmicutes bacterium]|nr:LicD family protein [Bacillota bacterium]